MSIGLIKTIFDHSQFITTHFVVIVRDSSDDDDCDEARCNNTRPFMFISEEMVIILIELIPHSNSKQWQQHYKKK